MSINLHAGQSEVYEDLFVNQTCRFSVVNCSRGWGKSYMAATAGVTAVFELLELDLRVPNKTVYIIAPTYDQVTDIYYPLINYDLGMEDYALRSSRDLGRPGIPRFQAGGQRSVARLRQLQYDPIGELVENYRKLKLEVERQEKIRDGVIVELTATGKPRSYRAEIHHALYDKLIAVSDKLLRYGYGRVPETLLVEEKKPLPLIVNLTKKGETYVVNDDMLPDSLTEDHGELDVD